MLLRTRSIRVLIRPRDQQNAIDLMPCITEPPVARKTFDGRIGWVAESRRIGDESHRETACL